jgi:L,D-peptidoglycan transpeptidase YkuD (ErfK/YbiS/YcfS/YnhG family)
MGLTVHCPVDARLGTRARRTRYTRPGGATVRAQPAVRARSFGYPEGVAKPTFVGGSGWRAAAAKRGSGTESPASGLPLLSLLLEARRPGSSPGLSGAQVLPGMQ